ncbi:hypothetical protein FQA39_LY00486 [Lamprigera yunnana]|nr:hypothetical protein FQA39_LY00486 [Lamprigera yunnana]
MKSKVLVCVLCLAIIKSKADTNITVVNDESNRKYDNLSLPLNKYNKLPKDDEPMNRITLPAEESRTSMQVQPIIITNSNEELEKNGTKPKDFRPSPQIETYYEYNKIPVAPAMPEAKFFTSMMDRPSSSENEMWFEKPTVLKIPPRPPHWYNKVSFPTPPSSYLPGNDYPYPYDDGGYQDMTTTKNEYPYPSGMGDDDMRIKNTYSYPMPEVIYETTTRKINYEPLPSFTRFGSSMGSITQKFADLFNLKGSSHSSPPTIEVSGHGYGPKYPHSIISYESPVPTQMQRPMQSPWKKVIKFLSAVIPIGILISALTPRIINVTPVNTTLVRGRTAESQLLHSLNYINKLSMDGCEERAMCELILSTGAQKNTKKYAEDLMKTLTEQQKNNADQMERIEKIFGAIRTYNCRLLECNTALEESDSDDDTKEKL